MTESEHIHAYPTGIPERLLCGHWEDEATHECDECGHLCECEHCRADDAEEYAIYLVSDRMALTRELYQRRHPNGMPPADNEV